MEEQTQTTEARDATKAGYCQDEMERLKPLIEEVDSAFKECITILKEVSAYNDEYVNSKFEELAKVIIIAHKTFDSDLQGSITTSLANLKANLEACQTALESQLTEYQSQYDYANSQYTYYSEIITKTATISSATTI